MCIRDSLRDLCGSCSTDRDDRSVRVRSRVPRQLGECSTLAPRERCVRLCDYGRAMCWPMTPR
eukprot:5357330-Alexandrium_andersonii.AAC.1